MKNDVIIICPSKSWWNDNELRFTLRSVCNQYPNIGKVVVVNRNPDYLVNAEYIQIARDSRLSDEANILEIIEKVVERVELENSVLAIGGEVQLADGAFVELTPDLKGWALLRLLLQEFPEKSPFEKFDMKKEDAQRIVEWLESEEKDYNAGLKLYLEFGKSTALKRRLVAKGDNELNRGKLEYELRKIAGIGQDREVKEISKERISQIKKKLKTRQAPKKQTRKEKKGADVPKNPKEVDLKIKRSKETTNALLKKEWAELTDKEKEYFFNDEALFGSKKDLMLVNGDIHKEMTAIQAKLKAAKTDEERAEINTKLHELEELWDENWKLIDLFEEPKKEEPKKEGSKKTSEDSVKIALEKDKKIRNLKSAISKNKKKITDNPDHKNVPTWKQKIEEAENQLKELEADK